MPDYENSNVPLVTAVITTYKRKPDIVKRALKSIVNQNYPNIEIFVVNDYPDDLNLVESIRVLIEEFADKRTINYIVVDKNGGACKARNFALSKASGKYFACLDDDDEWLPDKIRLQVERGEDNPHAAIVYCNAVIRNEDIGTEHIRFKNDQLKGNIFSIILGKNNIGSCSFPLMRTEYLREVGGFNEEMPALQDWELYLRLLRKYDAEYVHEPVAVYYFYEGERISAHPENRIIAFENMKKEFQVDLDDNKKSASDFYLMGTYFYSLKKNMRRASYYYCKGVVLNPTNIKRNVKDFFRMIGRLFIKPKRV